jgi:hypothetical protein
MAEEMVRVLDPATGQLTTIPARELAPGMIRATVQGIEGEVWLSAAALGPSPLRHPPFGEELRQRMVELRDTFHDVYPRTAEEWEDGFRRDLHAEQEIAAWLHMAKAFRHFTDGRTLSPEQRRDIFDVIVATVNNGRDKVLLTTNPLTLSRRRVRQIVDFVQPEQKGKGGA